MVCELNKVQGLSLVAAEALFLSGQQTLLDADQTWPPETSPQTECLDFPPLMRKVFTTERWHVSAHKAGGTKAPLVAKEDHRHLPVGRR